MFVPLFWIALAIVTTFLWLATRKISYDNSRGILFLFLFYLVLFAIGLAFIIFAIYEASVSTSNGGYIALVVVAIPYCTFFAWATLAARKRMKNATNR